MKEIVFLNGKFLPVKETNLSALTPGFLYGWGLFETMRSYNNKIVYLDEHLKRIKRSCKLLAMDFPYSFDKLKEIIKETVKINGFFDAYVRLSFYKSDRGTDALILVKKYKHFSFKKYREGFSVCISRFKQNEDSFFARMKTTNYLLYQLSYLEAKNRGFDEAIILNNRGYITETCRANIFLVKDKELFTPSLECGCLDGITRKVILDLAKKYNIKIYEGNFTPQDLYKADESFLTNSLMGVMPLRFVGKQQIKNITKYKLTQFFMERYRSLL